ncbi:Retrotransposon protein [Gossypium australe]|uniref:Retrotransposon protein n=1 Tax=Gossypium australe TaxID=47621 RepID=A0A5B6VLF5_9ROSI|nr:Retrotransposon protein [Gossypium australe]
MCKCFIEGLNEDIKLLVGILDINEFVVLVEKACKVEELSKEKKKADSEARDERKRSMSKFSQPLTKRFRDANNRSNVLSGYPGRDRPKQSVGPKTQLLTESSVGSVKSNKPECGQCGRRHVGECWGKYINRTCYKCGSRDHFIRDCPKLVEEGNTLPVESTEFVIRVLNPLDKCVMVDKMCKNCPLMFRDACFPANLMLLQFDEFDIILGMDWLTLHNTIVNCKRKSIDLRSQNGLPAVVSAMKALNYVRKGCKAYFAYVIDTKVTKKKV